jgi:SAM-dependent methyltransferase
MSFKVGAEAYDRFMGRYSAPLAPVFVEFAAIGAAEHVLDVGCGPGALTSDLVSRLGAGSVSAVDPSESFVTAARARHPGVEIHSASAEELPFSDDRFDAALAQLVVHFMADPLVGLGEMRRVTRPGGVVAACVWDHQGDGGPLSVFWKGASELDPAAAGEGGLAGAHEGHLADLFREAGLHGVEDASLAVSVVHASFDEWWEPFTLGVGPAGSHVAKVSPEQRIELRERCRAMLPTAPFTVTARAWAARGLA